MTTLLDNVIQRIFLTQMPVWASRGARILLVVPDTTRSGPIARLLGLLLPILREAGAQTTVLVALGTHPPLPEAVLRRHLGAAAFSDGVRVLNHAWDDPAALFSIGTLSADDVAALSGGLLAEPVDLRVNAAVREADGMIVLHPVFPHELVGFSGGSKYLFPGISGPEMIDVVHWLGALCGSGNVIGRIDTPSRRVLDAAAEKMPLPMHGFPFVCHDGEVKAMEAGELRAAWRRAAAISRQVHVTRTPRRYRKVLACSPAMYADMWTGGKCVYKCEPVVEDGGELIVYAPHVACFSETHEAHIRALGYHVRDYFLANWARYAHLPRAVMAHCAIVKGDGTCVDGVERPRIRVAFASQIPREVCEAAGIGHVDPASIDPAAWKASEDDSILFVERAGEQLLLPPSQPEKNDP